MIICVGQAIVDHIGVDEGAPLPSASRFASCLGGSAANVAVGLHHHGVPVRLWSRVGDDDLGRFALDALAEHGLDTSGIARDAERPTRSTRIGVDDRGRPALVIEHPRSADLVIALDGVEPEALAEARALYLGGTMLLGETSYRTARALLERARTHGCLVAFDPNIRPSRTRDPVRVRARLSEVLPFTDLVQTGREAWSDLWGDRTPEAVVQQGPSLLVLTDGQHGARFQTARYTLAVPAERAVAVDPTGAGDAFMAALLARVVALRPGASVADLPASTLAAWGRFAAAWGARAVRYRGGTAVYAHERRATSGGLDR